MHANRSSAAVILRSISFIAAELLNRISILAQLGRSERKVTLACSLRLPRKVCELYDGLVGRF